MRKSFKHILLAGLTIASTAMAMNAQTLTQDWKVTEGLPTAGNARWGIGFDGKVYTNDKSVPQIIAINAEGQTTVATSAVGNVMSETGGAFYITPAGSGKIAKIFVARVLKSLKSQKLSLLAPHALPTDMFNLPTTILKPTTFLCVRHARKLSLTA